MLRYLGRNVSLPKSPPTVGVWPHRPKQVNGTDCGIYVMKYMDYILQGFDLGALRWSQEDVEVFRYRIAVEIQKGEARRIPGFLMRQRIERAR